MKRALISVLLPSVALFAVVACGSDNSNSQPQPKVFNINLTPQGETPPCPAAGVGATGTAKVTIAADNSTVTVDVTYSNLSGPATASHIHAEIGRASCRERG